MDRLVIERSDSSTSTLSCITVENDALNASLASSSTPPTSINEAGSTDSAATVKENDSSAANGRARRSRQSAVSYNESVLAGTARPSIPRKSLKTPIKTDSEETLIPKLEIEAHQLVEDSIQVLNLDWEVDTMPGDEVKRLGTTKRSKARVENSIANASSAVRQTASALGKRSRDALGTGKEKLQDLGRRRSLRQKAQIISEPQESQLTPSKRGKVSEQQSDSMAETKPSGSGKPPNKKHVKRWLLQGLYVGQDPDFDPRLNNAKNQRKREKAGGEAPTQRKILPLPMFAGKRIIEQGRNFRLPFDVFSPLPAGQPKPEEWKKTRKSEFSD